MGLTTAKGSALTLDDTLQSTATGEGLSKVNTSLAGSFGGINAEAALESLISGHFLSSVNVQATNYTVLIGDKNALLQVSGTSLISLLPAATAGNGFAIVISNNGTGVVTVDGSGAETINGDATVVLAADGWIMLTCDGTNWSGVEYVAPVSSSTDLSNYTHKSIDRLLQSYGTGADGAFSTIGATTLSDSLYDYTTFNLNSGHLLTIDVPVCIIRATTSISIVGDLNARGVDIAAGAGAALRNLGDSLGASGGGGGAGGSGGSGHDTFYFGYPGDQGGSTYFAAGGAGGISHATPLSAAVAGSSPAANQKALIPTLFSKLITRGGGCGGKGGASGGYTLDTGSGTEVYYGKLGGNGGLAACLLILIAPVITIDAGATIDLTGAAGTAGTASTTTGGGSTGGSGGGGGGAGGVLVNVTPDLTNAGTVTVTGGIGGAAGAGGGAAGADGADGYVYTIDPTV